MWTALFKDDNIEKKSKKYIWNSKQHITDIQLFSLFIFDYISIQKPSATVATPDQRNLLISEFGRWRNSIVTTYNWSVVETLKGEGVVETYQGVRNI